MIKYAMRRKTRKGSEKKNEKTNKRREKGRKERRKGAPSNEGAPKRQKHRPLETQKGKMRIAPLRILFLSCDSHTFSVTLSLPLCLSIYRWLPLPKL